MDMLESILWPNAFWYICWNTACVSPPHVGNNEWTNYKYSKFHLSYLAVQFNVKQQTIWQYAPPLFTYTSSNVPEIRELEWVQNAPIQLVYYSSTLFSWVLTGAVYSINGVSRVTWAVVSSISIDARSIMMAVVYILHALINICTKECLLGHITHFWFKIAYRIFIS